MVKVISAETQSFVKEVMALPPVLAAYGVATCVSDIQRMLATHGRRFQEGSYKPHLHAAAIREGWLQALLAADRSVTPAGFEQHAQIGVNRRADLMDAVGTTISVFGVRYYASQSHIGRDVMMKFEDAFTEALASYGIDRQSEVDAAWPVQEARVDKLLAGLVIGNQAVDTFWGDVVLPLCPSLVDRQWVLGAFDIVAPTIAQSFRDGYARCFLP